MTNRNFLEGMWCPKCGQEDRLFIEGTSVFSFNDDGPEDYGDVAYEQTSYCECPECGHHATVDDFTHPPDDEDWDA